jgi:hypothetical protein
LNKRILGFVQDGKPVLGFDTGLDARSFAQTKMSLFITQPGHIVYPEHAYGARQGPASPPDEEIEIWQAGGVTELARQDAGIKNSASQGSSTMVIWGPHFPGEELAEVIINKDEALDALRYWLKARIAVEKKSGGGKESVFPGPAGALIVTVGQASKQALAENPYPVGTVFFPPARLLKRTLDADGVLLDAERWIHPDLEGAEGISFCAGTMLYYVFCNAPPFQRDNSDELRQDIREGVFVPPNLAAPGLDPDMADLITRAISPIPKPGSVSLRRTPEFISDFIGPQFSKPASSWLKTLSVKEISDIGAEREQYKKKTASVVKTRRFLVRNAAIIAVCFVALFAVMLFVRGLIQSRVDQPTTRGMTAIEVAEAYYGAFNALDHFMMQACVTGRAGRDDIQTVTSLFVVSRVRQAYETGQFFMSAQEWIEAARPATDRAVFGITELVIRTISSDGENTILEADYIFWISAANSESEDVFTAVPEGFATRDILTLAFQRGEWRITNIERQR